MMQSKILQKDEHIDGRVAGDFVLLFSLRVSLVWEFF